MANAVYVLNKNAKTVKNQLEAASLLDLTHPPADPAADLADVNLYIAIPVGSNAISKFEHHKDQDKESCYSPCVLVESYGQQTLPFRTSVFARHTKKDKASKLS
jgi:hypothetical protein